MNFKKYVRPQSFGEAIKILNEENGSRIIGGTTFLRLSKKEFNIAIDLTDLELNYIKETDEAVIIGAYTSLRELETNEIIKRNFGNLFEKSVKNIIGIQFRNLTTIGGSVYGRFGFSDVITALSVLDCTIHFANHGDMKLDDFVIEGKHKDIIKYIEIKKNNPKTSYQMLRKSDADFPTLTTAVSKTDKIKIAIGSRPKVAAHALKAEKFINENELTDENILKAAEICSTELEYDTDIRSSKEYKLEVVKVLVKRALMEVK